MVAESRPSEGDERRPLLADQRDPPEIEAGPQHFDLKTRQRFLTLLCVNIVVIDFSTLLTIAPRTQILEDILCARARAGLDLAGNVTIPGDAFCKSPAVQGELAMLMGWSDTFDMLPGLALTLLFGYLADRVGRKWVLLLALSGLVLEELAYRIICWFNESIDIYAIWWIPLFQILGGGGTVATSMVLAMVVDVWPATERANVFFTISGAAIAGEIVSGPLSALLMLKSAWLPMQLGFIGLLIGLVAVALLPETYRPPEPGSEAIDTPDSPAHPPLFSKAYFHHQWAAVRASGLLSLGIFFVLLAEIFSSVGRTALMLIVQYAAKRFSLSFATAGLIITFKAIVNMGVLLLVLPQLSAWLSTRMSPAQKDATIVRGSAWVLAAGAAIMAISPLPAFFIIGVCILAAGWGYFSAIRSLAAGLVPPSSIGLLSSLIGLAGSVGSLVAGPSLALSFKQGMLLGGFWTGLPYMIATGLFVGAAVLVSCIRMPKEDGDGTEAEGEGSSQDVV